MALVVGGISVELQANAATIINQMNAASRAVQSAANQMQGSTNRWAAGFNNAERRINSSLSGIGRGLRSLQGAFLAFGAGLGAREIVRYADSYKLVTAQLQLVTGSATEAAAVQERLFQSAQQLGIGVEALNTIFIRTSRNAESLGVSQDDVLRTTEALGAAVRISGASAAEAGNALLQLSQSFASGVLRGDELRSVSEQLPVVLDAIAAATGRTRQEVINFARENGLAADLVIESVNRMRDTWVQQADTMGGTVEQAMTRIQNAIERIAGKGGEAGVFQPLIDSLNSFASSLESPRFVEAIAFLGARIADFARLVIDRFTVIASVARATFEGRFADALNIVEEATRHWVDAAKLAFEGDYVAAVERAIGKTKELGAAINQAQVNALYPPAAPAAIATRAPLPPLALRGAPATGTGAAAIPEIDIRGGGRQNVTPLPGRFDASGFQVGGLPGRFDPSQFKVESIPSPQFGPPTPPSGFLAEEQRGQEMIAANDRLIAQYAQLNQGVQTFGQAFGQFAATAILKADTLTEAFYGFVESLAQAAIQAAFTQLAISAIGTAGGGGGLLGSLFPAPRALGGSVRAYSPYMVGERGPELFVPSRAGQIVPNNQLGGGGGSVINIDARQSMPGTAAAAVAQAVRLAPNAVVNAQARGMAGRGRAPF